MSASRAPPGATATLGCGIHSTTTGDGPSRGFPTQRSARRAARKPGSRRAARCSDRCARRQRARSTMRTAASARRASASCPERTAATIASCSRATVEASMGPPPIRTASAPAASAATAAASISRLDEIAPMSMASVTISPRKPSCWRNRPVSSGRLTVAGTVSYAGTTRWAVITARTPASMAARNGTRAPAASVAASSRIVGRPACESTVVFPCPGKCLAQAATPSPCRPSTKAATWAATRAGRSPKARTPITGFSGSTLTSATGAKSRSIPASSRSRPIEAATWRVSARSSIWPRARLPG